MDAIVSAGVLLLHALFRGPGYGLELFRSVGRSTRGRLRVGPGNGYPALARLARRGLVRSWDVRRGRGRPRRYFELTAAGVGAVLDQRNLIAGLVQVGPGAPATPRERSRMAERIDECAELSDLAASLREQVADRPT